MDDAKARASDGHIVTRPHAIPRFAAQGEPRGRTTLSTGATISGLVRDAAGTRLTSGVSILLLDSGSNLLAAASVASDGTYTFLGLPPASYYVAPHSQSYLFTSTAISLTEGQDATVSLSAVPGRVYGTIMNPDGDPVANATVMLVAIDAATQQTHSIRSATSSDGMYQLAGCPAGALTIIAESAGFAQGLAVVTGVYGADTNVDMLLATGVQLSGSVVDDVSDEVLPGAEVYVVSLDTPNAPTISVSTDASGRWTIAHLAPGSYRLIVTAGSYAAYAQDMIIIASQSVAVAMVARGYTLQGTVIDSHTELPLGQAFVLLFRDGCQIMTVQSDEFGRFMFTTLSEGQYDVVVAYGQQTEVTTLSVTDDLVFVFRLSVTGIPRNAAQGQVFAKTATLSEEVLAFGWGSQLQGLGEGEPVLPPLPAPQTIGQPIALAWERRTRDNERYDSVIADNPWADISLIPPPAQLSCCSPGDDIDEFDERYEEIEREYQNVYREIVGVWKSKRWYVATDWTLRAAANSQTLMAYTILANLESGFWDYLTFYKSVATLLAGEWKKLPGKELLRFIGLVTAWAWVAKMDLINVGDANGHLLAYEQYIYSIKANRQQFNDKVADIQTRVKTYKENLEKYNEYLRKARAECKDPKASSETRIVCARSNEWIYGEVLSDDVQRQLDEEEVNFHVELVGGGVDGLELDSMGRYHYFVKSNCGAVSFQYRLVIDCGHWSDEVVTSYGSHTIILTCDPCEDPGGNPCTDEAARKKVEECLKRCAGGGGAGGGSINCGNYDPNEISGPLGFGAENWVAADQPLAYAIHYENDPELAQAPVQHVRVEQTLDSDVDIRSFRLGVFGFGSVVIEDSVGRASYQARLDLRDELGIYVDVMAGLDVTTGKVFWDLTAIDPATGQIPESPLVGFLPPNANGSEGLGFVTYSVRPRRDAQTGDVIHAKATIVFDINPPIDTPEIFNTIDAGTPISQVDFVVSTGDPRQILVAWSGTDDAGGSGLADYTLYVSEDGGPFRLWLDHTGLTQAPYVATPGRTYTFYGVAEDNAGNREAAPLAADAAMTVAGVPGFAVTPTDGLSTSEAGGMATFTVVLNSAPLAEVTIAVALSDTREGTVSVTSLAFTVDDWFTPRIVTITGVADGSTDGDTFYSVQVGPVTSDDANYAALPAQTVLVVNRDEVTPPTIDVFVNASSFPTPKITATFTESLDLQAMIDDGSILSAVSLANYSTGPMALTGAEFAYDDSGRTLTIALPDRVPTGRYELRLDGSKLKSPGGVLLHGWRSVRAVQDFDAAVNVQADGSDLRVAGYSVPALADWNSDGLADLIVGEKTADGEGKVRVYLNQGSYGQPVFSTFAYAQTADGDVTVPASGCLGAFPRAYDWDGDGRKDLLIGLADGRIQLWTNVNVDSDPVFTLWGYLQVGPAGSKADIDVGDRAAFDIVDWNNDGRVDLVVGGLDGQVRVYLNQAVAGLPDFATISLVRLGATSLSVPTGRASVAVADLNGDGRKDLLLGNTEGQLWFYANTGFDSAPEFDSGELLQAGDAIVDLPDAPRSRPFLGDFNGDGLADILVGSADGCVRFYRGLPGQTTVDTQTTGRYYTGDFQLEFSHQTWAQLSPIGDSTYGQEVTFMATVWHFFLAEALTGTVQFFVDGESWDQPIAVDQDKAWINTSALPAGTHTITASYGSDKPYVESSQSPSVSLVVRPAELRIIADDKTKRYGEPLPELTVTYSGFVNGDTPASLTTPPALATTATKTSLVGSYPITADGASATDYVISYAAGTLTVVDCRWQNPVNQYDVDGKDGVTPLDVLLIINYINAHPGAAGLPPSPVIPPPFYNVSGDNAIAPLDVLMVINYINSRVGGSGEGERLDSPPFTPAVDSGYPSSANSTAFAGMLGGPWHAVGTDLPKQDAQDPVWTSVDGQERSAFAEKRKSDRKTTAHRDDPVAAVADWDDVDLESALAVIADDIAREWSL